MKPTPFDVAIVGGGPAGLSAAIVLARCRRTVVVFDDGKPRNYAAREVHGYLGLEGISPWNLREAGRKQALHYGATHVDGKVCRLQRVENSQHWPTLFEVATETGEPILARKLLLATGVVDVLPNIANIEQYYGTTVHHCPYCDGWEHRDQHLVALGQGKRAVGLALMLRTWSDRVTACTQGEVITQDEARQLRQLGIEWREEVATALHGADGKLQEIAFTEGPPLACDALFFNTDQYQRSLLPQYLGCELDAAGQIVTRGKQGTGSPGLFLAGDADGDVQFAIVAAAEGAIAATAIHRELQDEDCPE